LFDIRYLGMVDKIQGFGPPKGIGDMKSSTFFKQTWLK